MAAVHTRTLYTNPATCLCSINSKPLEDVSIKSKGTFPPTPSQREGEQEKAAPSCKAREGEQEKTAPSSKAREGEQKKRRTSS